MSGGTRRPPVPLPPPPGPARPTPPVLQEETGTRELVDVLQRAKLALEQVHDTRQHGNDAWRLVCVALRLASLPSGGRETERELREEIARLRCAVEGRDEVMARRNGEDVGRPRMIVHGKLQRIRGMVSDGDDWERIDQALADAVEVAKDVEFERDTLRLRLDGQVAPASPSGETGHDDSVADVLREAFRPHPNPESGDDFDVFGTLDALDSMGYALVPAAAPPAGETGDGADWRPARGILPTPPLGAPPSSVQRARGETGDGRELREWTISGPRNVLHAAMAPQNHLQGPLLELREVIRVREIPSEEASDAGR